MKNLVAEIAALEGLINTADAKLQRLYNEVPEPTNVSVSMANKAYEDIKNAEKEACKVYVKLQVVVNRTPGFESQKTLADAKWSDMSDGVAKKFASAEDYVARYGAAAFGEEKMSAPVVHNVTSTSIDHLVVFSFMAVTLENKLHNRMKNEFSLEYTRDESKDKERIKSLLKYLIQQRKAAHMRNCNYKTEKKSE